jgi:5-methylcytosine-specific restriction endonuclease McrA
VRYEFGAKVRRQALERSGNVCEASGVVYGLPSDTRCTVPLGKVEFDHWPVAADVEGSNVLENCVACCPACHARKTRTYDIPMQAKSKRIRKANGTLPDTRKHKPKPIRSAPFRTGGKTPWPKRSFRRETNGS